MDLTKNDSNQIGKATIDLSHHKSLLVSQVHEIFEFFNFETRNKYRVIDERQQPIAYAAEQQKGFLGFIFRQFLGHWRTFKIHIFDSSRQLIMVADHPFRFYFSQLDIFDANNRPIGTIQKRFSILSKRFEIRNSRGKTIMEVSSPIWKFWTFEFFHGTRSVAAIRKRWSGLFSEWMTDRDNFVVEFSDPGLSNDERQLVLAAAFFVDLQYFERKAR